MILKDAGFEGVSDFMESSFHVKLLLFSFPVSAVSAFIELYFGLQGITVFSFALLLGLELITGIASSLNQGEKISSRRFSRFIFKLCIWLCCFFILNSFAKETEVGTISNYIYTYFHSTLFIYITIEYLLSVLENMGRLSGKSTAPLVKAIRKKMEKYLDIEEKVKEKKEL